MARASTKGTTLPATAPKGNTLPSTISFEDEVAALRGRIAAPTGDKIKVDNKIFKLPNGESADMISVIIVDFVYFNQYYEGAYDPNNIVPPTCFSLHPEPKGAVPSPNSQETQCDACDGCAQNQFGSAGKGKACKNGVRMAVLPPDATEETPLMLLEASPTALKAFSAYIGNVGRVFGRPSYAVITDVTCDETVKYDSIRFGNPQPVEDDMIPMIRARLQEARDRLMTEPDMNKAANDTKGVTKGKAVGVRKVAGRGR